MRKRVEVRLGLDLDKIAIAVTIFLSCFFFTTYYATSILTFKNTDATTDVAVVLNSSGYYINAVSASEGTVQLNLASTPTGAMALAKDTLNVKSNAPEGYKVYVAMARDDDCTTNCNSLYKDKGGAQESSITATSGTFGAPKTLDSNSWGFAINKNTAGAPENTFSPSYDPAIPDNTTLWASMPLKGHDQLLQTVTAPDATDGVNTDIYYGVKANTTLSSGVYEGTIVYTVVGMAGAEPEIADITPSTTYNLTGGDSMIINTLYTMTPEQAGTANVTIGGKDCGNVVLSQNADNNLIITCDSPAQEAGTYDVVVSIPNYNKEATLVNAVTYTVDTENALNMQSVASWSTPAAGATTSTLSYPAGYYAAGSYDVNLGNADASKVLAGTTFSSNVAGLDQTGTMASYSSQYDSSKTAAQNTADAGLTWNADKTLLSIAAGYHVAQTMSNQKVKTNITSSTYLLDYEDVQSSTNTITRSVNVAGGSYYLALAIGQGRESGSASASISVSGSYNLILNWERTSEPGTSYSRNAAVRTVFLYCNTSCTITLSAYGNSYPYKRVMVARMNES